MAKYKVTYNETYKWATISETWIVDAKSEEQAQELTDGGAGEYQQELQRVVRLDNLKESEFIDAEKISNK